VWVGVDASAEARADRSVGVAGWKACSTRRSSRRSKKLSCR